MNLIEARTGHKPKLGSLVREAVETTLIAVAIFVGVNAVTARFRIDGTSMEHTLHHGQYVIVNRISYKLRAPQPGDVVVFVPPKYKPSAFWQRLFGLPGETDFIKRIIGKPGDTVQIADGKLYLNDSLVHEPYLHESMRNHGEHTWVLGLDEYFVLGDNRNFSKDSRDKDIGPIPIDQVVGKVWAVYYPLRDWKLVQHGFHKGAVPSQ